MVEDNLIEGTLKYRDGKKWKQRWALLNKLSPVADVLQLQLYKDSRDKARGAPTKASLALTNTLALITGFTLDKESHTLALLCKDLSLLLAFESRDRLLQWNSKLNTTFGVEQQFLVQLVQTPLKSRAPLGPSRLHVRNHRFCLTSGTPPRLMAVWSSADVRRYGVVEGRFVWEGGTRCGRGAGIHVALSNTPHDVTRALDMAARGGLASHPRRPPSASGTLQRDTAVWLREIGAFDLSKYSDAGETTSIMASEAGSILSPHGVGCHSRSDLSSGHWSVDRRPSCAAHDSYITGGSSSSSGSLPGDDPGWWANTWTSGRGSLWEVTPPSPVPDNLYDSPRSIIHHQPFPCGSQLQQWCGSTSQANRQHRHCGHCQHRPCVIPNPLDNYDVPKSHFLNYDTPRRIHTQDKSTCYSELPSRGVDACGRVLGWAEALMCRKQESSLEYVEPVKLSGEGRMPVLDANTGTIIHPKSKECSSISCSYQCSSVKDKLSEELPRKNDIKVSTSLHSSSNAIYAVIDKTKKIPKPRAPSPPVALPRDQSDTKPNYANMTYSNSSKSIAQLDENVVTTDLCYQCGGMVPSEVPSTDPMAKASPLQPDPAKKEEDYLIMEPASCKDAPNADYLCMNSSVNKHSGEAVRRRPFRPGRSLSLARHDRSPSPHHRRSSSADSRLHEPWQQASQFNSPDQTPTPTPSTSPPLTPFKSSTPYTDGLGRGRPRKRIYCHGDTTPTRGNLSNVSSIVSHSSLETHPSSDGPCPVLQDESSCPVLRRSSSVPGQKSVNRDSASSSDSGVCESPRPSDRVFLSHCFHNSLPRGTRKRSGFIHTNNGLCVRSDGVPGGTVDAKSSSSGTSDISDYLDTLSMSSHSSSDHERLRASVTTLRPRSGREYSRLDRIALEALSLPSVGEVPTAKLPSSSMSQTT